MCVKFILINGILFSIVEWRGQLVALTNDVLSYFKEIIGTKREITLGKVSSLMIKRYALAVGETNPLYFDRDFATAHGYSDIIAPPNLIASIMDWSIGEAESELNEDGLSKNQFMLGKELPGLRIMGGGEEKQFYKAVTAGSIIKLKSVITDSYSKQGRKGEIGFVIFENTYFNQDGEEICVCKRTMIAR